jgi:hypothetical protein
VPLLSFLASQRFLMRDHLINDWLLCLVLGLDSIETSLRDLEMGLWEINLLVFKLLLAFLKL